MHNFDSAELKTFVNAILKFTEEIKVPWRFDKKPLKVLVGELLIIRTKVKQAVRVYNEFFSEFPEGVIPDRKKEKALSILKKAGLIHRAKGIIKLLDEVKNEEHIFEQPQLLKKFPYVSDYVLSAVLFFAYGYNIPLIDSNVIRLLNRYLGYKVGDGRHPTEFHKKTMEYLISLAGNKKREFILKILDFSILICKHRPLCKNCCLKKSCKYYNSEKKLLFKKK